jgi:prepilin-type N-terminal cleavage/methylation domain-containing protein
MHNVNLIEVLVVLAIIAVAIWILKAVFKF